MLQLKTLASDRKLVNEDILFVKSCIHVCNIVKCLCLVVSLHRDRSRRHTLRKNLWMQRSKTTRSYGFVWLSINECPWWFYRPVYLTKLLVSFCRIYFDTSCSKSIGFDVTSGMVVNSFELILLLVLIKLFVAVCECICLYYCLMF